VTNEILNSFFLVQAVSLASTTLAMRGLNLSRLARSSEASYFSELQPAQAARLRKSLTPEQVAAARVSAAQAPPTVDTVASIAGQSAYRKLIEGQAAQASLPVTHGYAKSLLMRLRDAKAVDSLTPGKSARPLSNPPGFAPDPSLMRALGQNRLNLYQRLSKDAPLERPLPGSDTKAEAAVMGIQAFVVATAIVGTCGVASVLYIYMNPLVVDRMRNGTVRLRYNIESGVIGVRLRELSEKLTRDGGLVSTQTVDGARQLASKIVKKDDAIATKTDGKHTNDMTSPASLNRGSSS
jgi:hypothetical protein